MTTILVLIVEDEPLISISLEEALTDAGYECFFASNGQKALEKLNQDADRFKALLTGIKPGEGPDGWDVGHLARELVPDMPIIYMSGDSGTEWSSKSVPNSLMITKPYAFAEVVTAVSQLINDAAMARASMPKAG